MAQIFQLGHKVTRSLKLPRFVLAEDLIFLQIISSQANIFLHLTAHIAFNCAFQPISLRMLTIKAQLCGNRKLACHQWLLSPSLLSPTIYQLTQVQGYLQLPNSDNRKKCCVQVHMYMYMYLSAYMSLRFVLEFRFTQLPFIPSYNYTDNISYERLFHFSYCLINTVIIYYSNIRHIRNSRQEYVIYNYQ